MDVTKIRTLAGIPDVLTSSELPHHGDRSDQPPVWNSAAASINAIPHGKQHFWFTWFAPTVDEDIVTSAKLRKTTGELSTLCSAGVARWRT